MTYQYHILQTFVFQYLDNIFDMHIKGDIRRVEMSIQVGAFTHARKGRRKHVGSCSFQKRNQFLPTPTTVPSAVDQNVGCHIDASGASPVRV